MDLIKQTKTPKMNKPPKIVIAPISRGDYITEGKEYEVDQVFEFDIKHGYAFSIIDNEKDTLFCLENDCGFLNGLNWIIKERQS